MCALGALALGQRLLGSLAGVDDPPAVGVTEKNSAPGGAINLVGKLRELVVSTDLATFALP